MLQSLLGYVLIVTGGVLWGVGITIYWGKKCRVIHDLLGLISCLIVVVLMIMCGIDMVEENQPKTETDTYNPVVVENLDIDVLNNR